MTDWRISGCVADSDEELDVEQDIQWHGGDGPDPEAASTARSLQYGPGQHDQHGQRGQQPQLDASSSFEARHRGHSPSPLPVADPTPWTPLSSTPSSPLTNFSLSPPECSDPSGPGQDGPMGSPAGLAPPLAPPEIGEPGIEALELEARLYGHALRKRNPIQVHPYMLEGERYRQFLKANGVRPLKIVAEPTSQPSSSPVSAAASPASDVDVPIVEQSRPQTNRTPETSQERVEAHSRPTFRAPPGFPWTGRPVADDTAEEDGELPDVNELLWTKPAGAVRQGYKKRKTLHALATASERPQTGSAMPIAAPDPHQPQTAQVDDDGDDDDESWPAAQRTNPILDLRRDSDTDSDVILRPSRSISAALDSHQDFAMLDEEPIHGPGDDPGDGPGDPDADENHGAGQEDNDDDDDDDANDLAEIRQVQRRIKGVLPASWLKLDLRRQPAERRPSRRKSPVTTSTGPEPRRGLAQRQSRRTGRAGGDGDANRSIFISSDESDQSDNDATVLSRSVEPSEPDSVSTLRPKTWPDASTDIPEDDRVDDMLPPKPRAPRTFGSRSRKRQMRLSDYEGVPAGKEAQRSKSSSNHTHRQGRSTRPSRPSVHARPPRARKPSPPRLSILDVASPRRPPDFISIAQRLARSRANRGRHQPTAKYFRLAQRPDTEEVHRVLRDWREGTLQPRDEDVAGRTASLRQPLYPGSANPRSRPAAPSSASSASRTHPAPSPKKPRPLSLQQTRLDSSVVPVLAKSSRSKAAPVIKSSFLSPWKKPYPTFRPAQLESTKTKYRSIPDRGSLGRRLSVVDQILERQLARAPHKAKLPLQRFLDDPDHPDDPVPPDDNRETIRQPETLTRPRPSRPLRQRKRLPQHVDADAQEYRQPEDAVVLHDDGETSLASVASTLSVLQHLGPFGTTYTVTFDISPLHLGTYFHESTFLGSGELARSLDPLHTKLSRRTTSFRLESKVLCWHSWSDNVASEFGSAVDWALLQFSHSIDPSRSPDIPSPFTTTNDVRSLLRFLVAYVSELSTSSDAADQALLLPFLTRCLERVTTLVPAILARKDLHPAARELGMSSMMMFLVLAVQVDRIALAIEQDRSHIRELGLQVAQALTHMAMSDMDRLRDSLETNKRLSHRELGIGQDEYVMEALVVTRHALDAIGLSWWQVINLALLPKEISSVVDARDFERRWYDMFSLLPLDEIDASGRLKVGHRFQAEADNWPLPRALVNRLVVLSKADPQRQPVTMNAYLRAVFSRCHHLIKSWAWRRCESIVGALFDFFAANNLAHLRNEEVHGSPRFLEELDQRQDLDLEPGDRCFHIFLKTVGLGLMSIRRLYPEKKIRNFVFRLIPNHGRQFPKEQSVRQDDLDSLRNHHDLLCVLHWAAPPPCRPSLNIIRDLVHAESSHREACHLSIRAWTNLARFQLSTDEPSTALAPFREWHGQMVSQLLRQRQLARVEAQGQFASASARGGSMLSRELLESNIDENQAQVEAILEDALRSMKNVMVLARAADHATALLEADSITGVFDLFDARKNRLVKLVLQMLDILEACVERCTALAPAIPHQASSESQDYGDWSGFEEPGEPAVEAAGKGIQKVVAEPLARLLSNAFGADEMPDGQLLERLITTWVSMAALLVGQGLKSWDDYLGSHGRDSWTSLRSTDQTRRYSGYMLSEVVRIDGQRLKDHDDLIMQAWMEGLVESADMVKFQARLTSSLLNAQMDEPLLRNLPFWRATNEGTYEITTTEFLERRLSLISSVLANMREGVDDVEMESHQQAAKLRQRYTRYLRGMMQSMKMNYQGLHHDTAASRSYAEFVQAVIGFLQQHTVEICAIDRFFTDSAGFPLPVKDPSYVVGRLRHYGLRLTGGRTAKQLVSFVQSVSERAAMDGQQGYLIEQLRMGMANAFESGDLKKPTLRTFFVQVILGPYVEHAFTTSAGWILAHPVLKAMEGMLRDLIHDLDGANASSVAACGELVSSMLERLWACIEGPVRQGLTRSATIRTLAMVVSTIAASLPMLDYLLRTSHRCRPSLVVLSHFHHLAREISDASEVKADVARVDCAVECQAQFSAVEPFTRTSLREALTQSWHRQVDGATGADVYSVVHRGNVRRVVDVSGLMEERVRGGVEDGGGAERRQTEKLKQAARGFLEDMQAFDLGGHWVNGSGEVGRGQQRRWPAMGPRSSVALI